MCAVRSPILTKRMTFYSHFVNVLLNVLLTSVVNAGHYINANSGIARPSFK